MKIIVLAVSLLLMFFATPEVHAAVTPLSISMLPPVQFPSEDFTITGVRASLLWGKHRDIYGLDIGLIGNFTVQTFTGIAVAGLFNSTQGTTSILGLQFAGLANLNSNKTTVVGLQAALGWNYNGASSSVFGVQLAGGANLAEFTDIYGLQVAIYNRAKEVYGFQIGLVNVVDSLHGIQIGLVNINRKGLFAVSPILNVGF